MSLIVIRDAYAEYETAVNALIALTNEKDYESTERRYETLKFHKRALRELKEKIESCNTCFEFMVWAQKSSEAYRLSVYGEHYGKRLSLHIPMSDFELLSAESSKKLEYLTTVKCLELYRR